MSIQKCSRVFSESDFGMILEGPGAPKVLFFANSWSGFAVFKKARISRVLEAILFFQVFCRFESVVFADSCNGFAVFLNSRARGVLGCLRIWGSQRALFSYSCSGFCVFKVPWPYRNSAEIRST